MIDVVCKEWAIGFLADFVRTPSSTGIGQAPYSYATQPAFQRPWNIEYKKRIHYV